MYHASIAVHSFPAFHWRSLLVRGGKVESFCQTARGAAGPVTESSTDWPWESAYSYSYDRGEIAINWFDYVVLQLRSMLRLGTAKHLCAI